ncbi:MAG TPA: PadR family transcriptional regulator [Candidatus Binataceae bacterium]|nr:PadR family transcriptional regulator [Candidatus Binataceae bacterium]
MFYENIFARWHGCSRHNGDQFAYGLEDGRRYGRFAVRGGFLGRFADGWVGGPGMRAARVLASGDLRLIILILLNEKPRHGYEIIKAIEDHSSGMYTPSPGMVYPALTYLEEMGHAAVEADANKKLYRITEAGAAYLAEHRRSADETLERLARFGDRMAHFQRRFAEEDEEAEDFADDRHGRGGREERDQRRNEWRRTRMEFHQIRDDLRAALREKIGATMEEKNRIFAILRRAIDEIRSGKPSAPQGE